MNQSPKQLSLIGAALQVLKQDWFVLIPAIIYSLGFSLLSPNWVLKENLSNAEMVQLFSQLGLFLVVQLWVQLFTIRMILQVIRSATASKNIQMNLSELLKNIFLDWFKLLLANALMFGVVVAIALALPGKHLAVGVIRGIVFMVLFMLFTVLPVVMTFNQFSLIKSFQFFGRVWRNARREFLYLLSMVIVFKLMLFILAIQVAFIPGLGRPLGVSLIDAFSLVMTLIMMVIVIRPISILTARVSRRA
jgi:hypothetical protein